MKRFVQWLFIAALLAVPGVHAGTLVNFNTAYGSVVVEMLDAEKPITVKNFLRYIDDGLYKDSIFHRCVTNFVIQGGGFAVRDRGKPTQGVANIPTYAAITNEYGVGPFRSNVRGTIAMAKTADPNSATSQFFFNTADNAALDNPANSGGFTVFGRVIQGDAILETWRGFKAWDSNHPERNQTNVIVNGCTAANPNCVFKELPLTRAINNENIFEELIYLEITRVPALALAVRPGLGGDVLLEWPSSDGVTYGVEFATTPTGPWQSLATRTGTGGLVSFNTSRSEAARYYRLRVGP